MSTTTEGNIPDITVHSGPIAPFLQSGSDSSRPAGWRERFCGKAVTWTEGLTVQDRLDRGLSRPGDTT
ncbi:hypothetical protein [Streptomyces sp. 2A115]|uniref:hypothetical protein n=1 Tax=Streptomyces sp. 2A115 TaxID=3457439 RepID=UPI003FD61DCA